MITFRVSDVDIVRTPMKTTPARARIEARSQRIEAFASNAIDVVEGPLVHPLWLAFHLAFEEHRPVVLRPDDVWIAIAQGIGMHIAQNADALRARFVRHTGKLDIDVRRDEMIFGDPNNDWPGAVGDLASAVRESIGGKADLFVCNFSTTGPFERTASEIVLLEAMSSYFEYTVSTLCGIPEIVLEGTPEDWANVRERARVIAELETPEQALDVAKWSRALDEVLAKIEETARGTIDREFWKRAYKVEHESGGDRTSGFLNAFFPYVVTPGAPPKLNAYALDPMREAEPFSGNMLSNFPDGLTSTPFTWRVLETKHAMELCAGPIGVARDDSGALRIAYAWAVTHARPKSPFVVRPAPDPWPSRIRVASHASELASLDALALHADLDLVDLWLWDCTSLVDLRGIEHLRRVTSLDATRCTALVSLEALRGRTELTSIVLTGCTALVDVSPLATLTELRYLCLMDCTSVMDVSALHVLEKLEGIVLWRCPAVPEALRKNLRDKTEIADALEPRQ